MKIFLLLLMIVILPLLFYRKIHDDINLDCGINYNAWVRERGKDYVVVDNILNENCRQALIDRFFHKARKNKHLNEDKHLSFYSNKKFLKELSGLVGEELFPVNSLDLQRCWLRYYFEGMKSQYYENDHYDIKRYNNSMKQYRLVIPVYNTSDSVFTIDGDKSFDFNTNMGVFLEAGKCLHRVEFSKGERFLLIMDFTTKDCDSLSAHYTCRNIVGYFNWCKDVVWRHLSSFHYRLSNL